MKRIYKKVVYKITSLKMKGVLLSCVYDKSVQETVEDCF